MDLRSYPPVHGLVAGTVLASIAEAIWTASGSIYWEQRWDGHNYRIRDGEGGEGVVAFADEAVVGVFCDTQSPRDVSPEQGEFDWQPSFAGAPPEVIDGALNGALRVMLDAHPGTITAAFWSEGASLAAAEPWQQVVANGAHVLRIQLLPPTKAYAACQENFGLGDEQTALLGSLFERRMARAKDFITVDPREYESLTLRGSTGIDKSRALLEAVGIRLP